MPEVNFDVKACGITTSSLMSDFASKLTSSTAPYRSSAPSAAESTYNTTVFLPSLRKIVSASRALMALLHHDHNQSTVSTTTRLAASSTGSGATAGVLTVDPDMMMVTEDILRHSPFCGCSQVVAAFGSALEVATANTKWQALAAQSNFETARMVLTRLKRLWPVAAVFEG